ncbi:MAG: TonB-dependent receptor [Saprospiraceae bacterium]|nr:MAG: TonB-dependent receptor [Saprospiraceae bacterium]
MKKLLLAGMYLLISNFIISQTQLSGKITDMQGRSLPGASVVLLETRQGTVADEQGNYRIAVARPGAYTLRASYVGFEETAVAANVAEDGGTVVLNVRLPERVLLLDVLTVQATRAGERSPFTYSSIGKAALESRNLGQDLPYLLDATPSVVVTSDAGAGVGYTGLRIRGTDPTRINVTINGIPLNDAESQAVFWVDLPDIAASTEDLQIQRGVGTSTNGAGAFGGTINLNTAKLHDLPYGEFSGTLGSFGTRKATVQFGTGLLFSPQSAVHSPESGVHSPQSSVHSPESAVSSPQPSGFSLDGRLSRIVSDGYIDRAGVDLKSFYLSAAWLGKKSALRANVFSGHEVTYQAWNGVPAQWVDDAKLRTFNVSGTEKPGTPHDNEVDDYTQTHYQLIFNRELTRNWNLNLAGHYTRGYGFFEQYKARQDLNADYGAVTCDTCPHISDVIRRRWLGNDFFGGTWALHFQKNNQRLQATLGGAWNQYLGEHFGELVWGQVLPGLPPNFRYYEGRGGKTDFNVFTKISNSFTPFLHGFLDLQYRRVGHDITGTDNDLREVRASADYDFFNPKAGLLLDVRDNATAYVSFAVGHREPNRDDFTDAPANARPQPERLYNTEAGFRLRQTKSTWSVNLYQMLYKNQLVLTGNINDVGAAIRRNVPGSYRLGLEVAGSVELSEKLHFDGNATLSQNKIKNFTEYVDNWDTGGQDALEHGTTDIAFSPNFMAFGKLRFQPFGQLELALSGKYVGSQFMDNTSNENALLSAYFVSGLQVRYAWKPAFAEEVSLNFLLDNLLGARYSSNAWIYRYTSASYDGRPDDPYTRFEGGNTYNLTGYYPQAGRNFLLGVAVKF